MLVVHFTTVEVRVLSDVVTADVVNVFTGVVHGFEACAGKA